MHGERGQGTIEWVALLLVVASILVVTGGVADGSWLPGRLRCAIFAQSCGATRAAAAAHAPDGGLAASYPTHSADVGSAGAAANSAAVRAAFAPLRASAAGLMHWVPGVNFKSDLNQGQAEHLARALRDRALNLAMAGFLLGVGGVKVVGEKVLRKVVAEIFGALSEGGSLELEKLGHRISDAISDARPKQRICVHAGLKGPTAFGIPAVPSPLAVPDLTAYPRHGKRC